MRRTRAVWMFAVTMSVTAGLSTGLAQGHFQFVANTGNNATIAIPASAYPTAGGVSLSDGDEIGVFTPGGLCVGAVVWDGANAALTVWGDDEQTPATDGARHGETLRFCVWLSAQNVEIDSVRVTFEQGIGTYDPNKMLVVASLGGTSTGVGSRSRMDGGSEKAQFAIYPNPLNPATNVSFTLDRDEGVRLQIIDVTGRVVAEPFDGLFQAGTHTVRINATALSSGVYLCRYTGGSRVDTRLMVILR